MTVRKPLVEIAGVTQELPSADSIGGSVRSVGVTVDGFQSGQGITAGSKGYAVVPFAGTISHWYLVADQAGSVTFDVKRSGASIIGTGNKPVLSSAQSADAAPADWTSVAIAAGDTLEFVVSGPGTLTRVTLVLGVST